jgi:2',3'-cyclic-nucleotide 2'-phosphodiesterase/3'-nucleotidase
MYMKSGKRVILISMAVVLVAISCSRHDRAELVLISTTDIHGAFFPYDFISGADAPYSLASVSQYLKEVRSSGTGTILLDNGDILQGQPEVYYYNFIDTVSPHLCAEILNYMQYDAATAGNHDFEAGHPVYDRLGQQYNFPILAANAVSEETGLPYFKPYTVLKRGGIKVAVLGLVTPSVPNWIPPVLYSGIEFHNMTETASFWMKEIQSHKPDIIVGLFHSGWSDDSESPLPGNSSDAVVYNVPGFDVVFTGHDHSRMNRKVVNVEGDTVLVLNAGSKAANIARVDVFRADKGNSGRGDRYHFKGTLIETSVITTDADYVERFEPQYEAVRSFVTRTIGNAPEKISSRDALFGPSDFTGMIHTVQLDLTGADISFAAPLSFDVSIGPGEVTVADMFKLYRYENMLYKIKMTGREIDGFLEHSAGDWFSTITSPDDFILNYRVDDEGKPLITNGRLRLRAPVYNFDSAAGIDYTVDLTQEPGNRIDISSLSDGRPFREDSYYTVAINSYRASGGGGHIRNGAGLSASELLERLVFSTDKDLRYYMIKWIEENRELMPRKFQNWKLVPERVVSGSIAREWPLIYGDSSK